MVLPGATAAPEMNVCASSKNVRGLPSRGRLRLVVVMIVPSYPQVCFELR